MQTSEKSPLNPKLANITSQDNPASQNTSTYTLTSSTSGNHPHKLQTNLKEDDEEQEFLLNVSLNSDSSQNGPPPSRFWVNFFMFFNICRSFIAIGVLAIPYGLSKIGKPAFFGFN